MKLIKYEPNFYNNPWSEFESLFERAFGLSHSNSDNFSGSSIGIRFNMYEDEKNRYLEAELPGIDKKDVSLELENAVLNIHAERAYKSNDKEHKETLSRSITVEDDIDAEAVKADLKDGVLTVELPKKASAVARKIKIK